MIASPASSNSIWVRREVRYWLTGNPDASLNVSDSSPLAAGAVIEARRDHLLIVHVAGELKWDGNSPAGADFDWSVTSALTRDLAGVFQNEPFWVDFRRERLTNEAPSSSPDFLEKIAAVAGPLHGRSPRDLVRSEYRSRTRRLVLAWSTATILLLLLGASLWFLRSARIGERRATAGQLTALSQLTDGTSPHGIHRAARWALESWRIEPSATNSAMFHSLLPLLPRPLAQMSTREAGANVIEGTFGFAQAGTALVFVANETESTAKEQGVLEARTVSWEWGAPSGALRVQLDAIPIGRSPFWKEPLLALARSTGVWAVANGEGEIEIRRIEDGRLLRTFSPSDEKPEALALSSDGSALTPRYSP